MHLLFAHFMKPYTRCGSDKTSIANTHNFLFN